MKVTNIRKPDYQGVDPKLQTPKSTVEWDRLCQETVALAAKAQDPRLTALEKALSEGTQQKTLRSLGIVCQQDLIREFSLKKT